MKQSQRVKMIKEMGSRGLKDADGNIHKAYVLLMNEFIVLHEAAHTLLVEKGVADNIDEARDLLIAKMNNIIDKDTEEDKYDA